LLTKGDQGPLSLTYTIEGDAPEAMVIVDLATRKVTNLAGGLALPPIRRFTETFPSHFKVIAGEAAYVLSTTEETLAALPQAFTLYPNYPNPFNPVTTLSYTLVRPSPVTLVVYDLLGREVIRLKDGTWEDFGLHRLVWNGRDARGMPLASGIFIARLVTPGYSRAIKMVLLK
jgi:hypothetical protein